MTIAGINSLYDAAAAAMGAADWDSAISYLLQLQARLASTPNVSRSQGGGSQSFTFNPGDIAGLIANCRRQKAAATAAASTSGPWQTCKVNYTRATTE